MKNSLIVIISVLIAAFALPASGQGLGMGGGMGRGGQGPKDEKKMVIKAAEGSNTQEETTDEGDDFLKKPPSFQMLNLSGYMRLRTDWMYRLNLGYHPHEGDGVYAPFQVPLSQYMSDCLGTDPSSRCSKNTRTSTNMRLRLNPVLRPSDTVSIHSTVDIFDNLVLGSTPSGMSFGHDTPSYMPYAGFDGNTAVYNQGSNSAWDSIRIKSLYGKVNLKLFDLAFGRMPNHFGLGLMHNGGEGFDADYGDYVDRVQISSMIPNWDLKVGLSWDFASQGISTQLLYPGLDQGQPSDLDDSDDNTQWTAFVMKRHSDRERKRLLLDGKAVIDWGAHMSFSQQRYSMRILGDGDEAVSFSNNNVTTLADSLVSRKTTMLTPDLWFALNYRSFSLEMELAGRYGWVTNLEDAGINRSGDDLNYLSFGGVLRMGYRWSTDVTWKLEFGYASGDDEYENSSTLGVTNYADQPAFPAQPRGKYNTLFMFHPSYHVDNIFFRRIMGTVYNATYTKLSFLYKQNQWRFGVHGILPFANEPVATMGNARLYGAELDADLSYVSTDGNFVIGISYGLFYPMDAMSRPSEIYENYAGEPSMAHFLQGRILIRF